MAIIVRFLGVVIPIKNIEKCKAVGGFKGILEKEKDWVGKKVLYDEHLYKDGAMSPDDIEYIVKFWEKQGLTPFENKNGKKQWKDLCVVDAICGPTLPCEWLKYEAYDGGGLCVWMKGKYMGRVIRPAREANMSVVDQLKIETASGTKVKEVYSEGIYREQNGEKIYGKSRLVFIHNLHYFLTELKIYEDGKIDCWDLVDFEEFKQKLSEGWIETSVPDGQEIDLHSLGSITIKNPTFFVGKEELIKEVQDIIHELKGEPTTMTLCRNAFDEYNKNPNDDNRGKLRHAYEAIPDYLRHYVLGDMDLKDSPITSIIYAKPRTINASDIQINFGGEYPPKDDCVIELFKKAYKGEILCHRAIIEKQGIVPHSDFKPKITEKYRNYFNKKIARGSSFEIFVYPKDGKFIMSDDYNAYNMYLERGAEVFSCIVLGEAKGPYVIKQGEPFKLPPLTVEFMD